MRTLIIRIKRFLLERRISLLQDEITTAQERRRYAVHTVASVNQFVVEAAERLRIMRSQVALLENARALPSGAVRGER